MKQLSLEVFDPIKSKVLVYYYCRVSSVQLVQLFLNHVQVVSMVTRLG